MNNISTTLGRKPLAVPPEILPLYKRADRDDLDAIFDLSRYYFSYEGNKGHLQAALYYKSLLIRNYPEDYDPYSCVVTMTDIAHILGLLDDREAAKDWFIKTYKYVFENYSGKDRRSILEETGYFNSLEAFDFDLKEMIMN